MKRSLFVVGILLVLCFCFSACSEEPAEEPFESTEITSIVGDWNCVDLQMEESGTTMTTEDMESLFGAKVGDLAHFTAYADGSGELLFMDEIMPFLWQETASGFDLELVGDDGITPSGERMTATLEESRLILVAEDSYDDGEGAVTTTITYTFEYVGILSKTIVGWDLVFDEEQTMAMNVYMNFAEFLVVDDLLYGTYGGENPGEGDFSAAKISSADAPELSDVTPMTENGNVQFLTEYDGYIYGILDKECIFRCEIGSDEVEVIMEGACDYFQIVQNKIWFTDENYVFCSASLDGSGKTSLLNGKEVYFPYVLPNGMIIYQDDADNESLHVYDPSSDMDTKLNDEPSYSPVIWDKYLFYVTAGEEDRYYMNRMDLFDGSHEVSADAVYGYYYFIEDGMLYSENGGIPGVAIGDWDKLGELSFGGLVAIPCYSNGDVRVFVDNSGERYITRDPFNLFENNTAFGFFCDDSVE